MGAPVPGDEFLSSIPVASDPGGLASVWRFRTTADESRAVRQVH